MDSSKVYLGVIFKTEQEWADAVEFFEGTESEFAPEEISKEWRACYFEVSSEAEGNNLEHDLSEELIEAGFDYFRFELEGDYDDDLEEKEIEEEIEAFDFNNAEQALECLEANAPKYANQKRAYMEISDERTFNLANRFKGKFGIFMRKSGDQRYLTEKYMGGLSADTFADLSKKFTAWYEKHFLTNRDNIAHYTIEDCEQWIAETIDSEYESEKAHVQRIFKIVKEGGAGWYNVGAYEPLLEDGQTVCSFSYDNESYCIGFELDTDAYGNE